MAESDRWFAVTAAHHKKFKRHVAEWQLVLGLATWRIDVSDVRLKGGALGQVHKIDLEQRTASIRLAERFKNTEPTDLELEKLAVHELLHVANHEMKVWAAEHGEPLCEDVTSAEHALINVLEPLLLKARRR